MKIIDCIQGSPEWIQARLGIPTSSAFSRIISPKMLKPSKSADKYLAELLAEWMLGKPLDDKSFGWMERGRVMECEAVAWYEWQRSVKVQRVGFCVREDGWVGCSPDGLVDPDGGLEIKTPNAATHAQNILQMSDDYILQVQGSLWITGRDWWDLVSYNPAMPPVVRRYIRDEKVIGKLQAAVGAFVTRLHDQQQQMIEKGEMPEEAGKPMPGLQPVEG